MNIPSGIINPFAGSVTFSRLQQFLKHSVSTNSTESGRVILLRPDSEKACLPIVFSFSGRAISVSCSVLKNAMLPIFLTFSGIVISFKAVSSNAAKPIEVTLPVIPVNKTFSRRLQYENNSFGISLTSCEMFAPLTSITASVS